MLEASGGDADALKKAFQDLQKASYKIAEALYKAAPAGAPGSEGGDGGAQPSGPSASKPTDDVIDAEVVEQKK